ncbi:MAG: IS21 family transposase [Planctomycetota bacterium]
MRKLMCLLRNEMALETAAAKAGMSENTARRYREAGRLPSEMRPERSWRTRRDPFAEVWPEVRGMLERAPGLQATTIFAELRRRDPVLFAEGQLRTLHRRVRSWRALHGPEREVYFPQVYRPGEQGQSDFTEARSLGITIGGEGFPHLLYHFVLPYSNWEWAQVCLGGETFEALSRGIQEALWRLGAVPAEHRTDNLSAATHELQRARGQAFTKPYEALLAHYGMRGSRTSPGRGNEKGDVEQAHRRLREALDQELMMRGSRDFPSREGYEGFLEGVLERRNAARASRLREELAAMRPLPAKRLEEYREQGVFVTKWSTIRVGECVYSVGARLVGHPVRARLYAERVEVFFEGERLHRFERRRPEEGAAIDYRHLVGSLVRKPGAFARYRYRDALFPSATFRRAYDRLAQRGERFADVEYVRILHLAARTMESDVEAALGELLEAGGVPEYAAVKAIVSPEPTVVPEVVVAAPDLSAYDAILAGGGA